MRTKDDVRNSDDVINSHDVIARIDELTARVEEGSADEFDRKELTTLKALNNYCEGLSDKWKYGEMLIRDSYFVRYAKEFLEDIGALPKDLENCIEIDWDKTASNLKGDYKSVDFDDVTYWIRWC